MTDADDIPRLNDLSDRLEVVFAETRIEPYITPANRASERDRFLREFAAGRSYDPQFEFPPMPGGFEDPVSAARSQVEGERGHWDALLAADLDDTLALLTAARTHSSSAITEATVERYGIPTPEVIRFAESTLTGPADVEPERTMAAEWVASRVRDALAGMHLDTWNVEVTADMNARMSVESATSTIRVRADARFSPSEVDLLLVHEVGTHVLRAANGGAQPLRLLRFGLHGYLATEEGLATWHESKFVPDGGQRHRTYALRALSCHLALEKGFGEICDTLRPHANAEELFDLVTRTKRGFTDTSEPGAHVKDHVYLSGYLKVSGHLTSRPEDYDLLMSGKASLDDLPEMRDMSRDGFLAAPRYQPAQFFSPSSASA